MKKKLFVVAILLAIFSFSLISSAFANVNMDTAVNGVRNFVGGAENVIEDAGQGVTNGVKNGMNTIDNGARDMTAGTSNGNDSNYNASRTTTRAGNNSSANGIFNTTNIWTWVVLATAGAVIVGLVMYYAKQNSITAYNNHDE